MLPQCTYFAHVLTALSLSPADHEDLSNAWKNAKTMKKVCSACDYSSRDLLSVLHFNPRTHIYLMFHWASGKWGWLSNFRFSNASSTGSSSSVYYFNLNSFTFFGGKGQGDTEKTGGRTANKQRKVTWGIATEQLHSFFFSIPNFKCTHFPIKGFQMLL